MSTGKEYVIKTIHDLFAVPADRREAMFSDFRLWLEMAGEFRVLFGENDICVGNFIWVDDGIAGLSGVQIRIVPEEAA